jgi:hypothetical protein
LTLKDNVEKSYENRKEKIGKNSIEFVDSVNCASFSSSVRAQMPGQNTLSLIIEVIS